MCETTTKKGNFGSLRWQSCCKKLEPNWSSIETLKDSVHILFTASYKKNSSLYALIHSCGLLIIFARTHTHTQILSIVITFVIYLLQVLLVTSWILALGFLLLLSHYNICNLKSYIIILLRKGNYNWEIIYCKLVSYLRLIFHYLDSWHIYIWY